MKVISETTDASGCVSVTYGEYTHEDISDLSVDCESLFEIATHPRDLQRIERYRERIKSLESALETGENTYIASTVVFSSHSGLEKLRCERDGKEYVPRIYWGTLKDKDFLKPRKPGGYLPLFMKPIGSHNAFNRRYSLSGYGGYGELKKDPKRVM